MGPHRLPRVKKSASLLGTSLLLFVSPALSCQGGADVLFFVSIYKYVNSFLQSLRVEKNV